MTYSGLGDLVTPEKQSSFLGIGYFIAPLPLLAVLVLALNDHYLKWRYPSILTGKLSDLAGVFFFPLFLCSLLTIALNSFNRFKGVQRLAWITPRQAAAAIVLTDFVFCTVKYSSAGRSFYLAAMSALGFPSRVVADRTDLIAMLVANVLTWLYVYSDRTSIVQRNSPALVQV